MSKQTAVQWLICRLLDGKPFTYLLSNEAKQMEKEQIIQSWHDGYDNQSPMIDEDNCGNTYYKETYGGDHK